jgi:hypothetical protein
MKKIVPKPATGRREDAITSSNKLRKRNDRKDPVDECMQTAATVYLSLFLRSFTSVHIQRLYIWEDKDTWVENEFRGTLDEQPNYFKNVI